MKDSYSSWFIGRARRRTAEAKYGRRGEVCGSVSYDFVQRDGSAYRSFDINFLHLLRDIELVAGRHILFQEDSQGPREAFNTE